MNRLNVLIGMECSDIVRSAFEKRGHNAVSCDLKPCEKGYHSSHWVCDIYKALNYGIPWDIIILHPDCTKLCVSGNRWYGKGTPGYAQRQSATEWTARLWEDAKRAARLGACLENPVSVIWKHLQCDRVQYIQPWMYGHGETKKTGLALDRLPELKPTNIVEGREQRVWKMAPSSTRKADRARTYIGIADAFANQWGALSVATDSPQLTTVDSK